MRLKRYMYSITHVPGKDLATADALYRAPREQPDTKAEMPAHVSLVVSNIPATERRLSEIRESQRQDEVCRNAQLY